MSLIDREKKDRSPKSSADAEMSVYVRWPSDRAYHQGEAVHVSAHGAFINLAHLPASIPRTIELVFVLPDGGISKLRRVSALVAGASTHETPTVFCSFGEAAPLSGMA